MKDEREKLKDRYSKLTNGDLLEILRGWSNYTETAVSVAKDELEFRSLTEEEVVIYNNLKEKVNESKPTLTRYSALDTFEKLQYYVFPFPKLKTLNPFKQKQAKYYSGWGRKSYALILLTLTTRINNLEEWMIYCGALIFALIFIVIQFVEDIKME